MGTVQGLTKERMLEIEAASVVSGEVVGDDLILTTRGGEEIVAGDVRGPQGTAGTDNYFAHSIGELFFWPGPLISIPVGSLLADGSAVSRTAYAELFAQIGTTHGAGNGTTTFNLPNMLGRVPVGYDAAQTEFNAIGKTGGEKAHLLTLAEAPAHTHGVGHLGGNNDGFVYGGGTDSYTFGINPDVVNGATGSYRMITDSKGGGTAHNILQPYLAGLWLIKALYTSGELNPDISTHAHAITDVTGLQSALDLKLNELPYSFATGADLNDYITTQRRITNSNTIAATMLNMPETYAGLLEVFATSTIIYQRYTVYATQGDRIWVRGRTSAGVWNAWKRIAFVNDAWTTVTLKTGYADYGVMASAPDFKLPRFQIANGMGEILSGWVGRSTNANIVAGTLYLDFMFDALPVGSRPDQVVVGTGQVTMGGTVSFVQYRIYANGQIGWLSPVSGTFGSTTASSLWLSGMRWKLA